MSARSRSFLAGQTKWLFEGETSEGAPLWTHSGCGFITRAGGFDGDGLPDPCPMCDLESRVRQLERT